MNKGHLAVVALALATGGCADISDFLPGSATAPYVPPPPLPQVEESPLPAEGEVVVTVWGAAAKTKSTIGPYTAFLVSRTDEPDPTHYNVKHRDFLVYVRSDDNVGALERGSIIGILMGAAETHVWNRQNVTVRIKYITTPIGIEAYAASIGDMPTDRAAKPSS